MREVFQRTVKLRGRWRRATIPYGVALLCINLIVARTVVRADRVIWSDGASWSGHLQSSGQGRLRFHDGVRLWQWRTDQLAALEWHPSTQRMERAWRFLEAGQTAREETGKPYPTIELQCTATLQDGHKKVGHLLTTVFYLEQKAETRKIVVRKKLRGKPGATYQDLRYPVKFVFDTVPQPDASIRRLTVTLKDAITAESELALVMALPATTRMPVKRLADGRFRCQMSGTSPVWALRHGTNITVKWKDAAPQVLRARLDQALQQDLRDFFDQRQLLGVTTNASDATVLSLVLFSRQGQTTLGGLRTQPWRLEVCRWRLAEDGQNQFAARAVLFRGVRSPAEPLPQITLDPELKVFCIEEQ